MFTLDHVNGYKMELVIRTNHLDSELPQPDILKKLDAWMHQVENIDHSIIILIRNHRSSSGRRPGTQKVQKRSNTAIIIRIVIFEGNVR